jgi:hypothetical protein
MSWVLTVACGVTCCLTHAIVESGMWHPVFSSHSQWHAVFRSKAFAHPRGGGGGFCAAMSVTTKAPKYWRL